ncbi:MAG: response regulator [Methanothrix sp.]|nr:response regulator [Methanothrix sp.]
MSTASGTAKPLSSLSTWFTTMMSSYLVSGSSQARQRRPRVLVIDDEGAIRELLSLYLDGKGLEVATARSADGARALVKHGQFDLVILDWMLKAADGLELLHSCKAEHPDIPVIVFTSVDLDKGYSGGGFTHGADEIVRKGGPLDALSTAVFRCLDRGQVQTPRAA